MCTFGLFSSGGSSDDVGENGSARVFCVKARPVSALIEVVWEISEGTGEEDRYCGERRKSNDQDFLAPGP